MKGLFLALLALVVFIIFVHFLSLNPPSPSRWESVQKENNNPQDNKTSASEKEVLSKPRVTEHISTAELGAAEAAHQHYERYSKPALDWWLSLATVLLAVITAVLAYFTYGLWSDAQASAEQNRKDMRDSIAEAAKAAVATEALAEATRKSVEAMKNEFTASHRPEIRIKHVYGTGEFWNGGEMTIETQVVNIGTTDATILRYFVKMLFVHTKETLPAIPEYGLGVKVNNDAILKAGASSNLDPDFRPKINISNDDTTNLYNGNKRLYCFGFIEYKDDAGCIRTTTFCRYWFIPKEWAPRIGKAKFVVEEKPDPDYEYQD